MTKQEARTMGLKPFVEWEDGISFDEWKKQEKLEYPERKTYWCHIEQMMKPPTLRLWNDIWCDEIRNAIIIHD